MNWEKHGIDISKVRGGKTTCPKCSHERKNKTDLCLSVDFKTGLFNCHNGCGFKGSAANYEKPKKEFQKPIARLEKLSPKTLKFFEETRGIENNTLLRFGITESLESMPGIESKVTAICFNYLRNEELVNIKFRGPKKSFKMSAGSELIFYNLDSIKDESCVVIVEGEIDCLTVHQCGFYSVVSVPNGASKGSQKLEYLDNCWQEFEGKEKIILAVDDDEAGRSLREELARRLGKERCLQIVYPEGCKDANEVMLKHNRTAVAYMIDNATPWPIEGVLGMDEMFNTVVDYYQNGYPEGARAEITGFDELLTFAPGQLTTITGIPGSGKDEYMNWVMTRLSKNHEWNWAVFGFEEPPEVHVTKLIEKFTGKSFGFRKNLDQRVNEKEFEYGVFMVDKYFHFVNTDEVDVTMEGIIDKAKQLVKRYGIKGMMINPWNWIEHKIPKGYNETQYVSEVLSKLLFFLKHYGVHCFLIAHPTKMMRDRNTGKYEIPTMYSISGSAHFFNKTHNGICVWRDFETNTVDVYVQKVKHPWLGKIGFASFSYDTFTRQYNSIL